MLVVQFERLELLQGREHHKTSRNICKDKFKGLTHKQYSELQRFMLSRVSMRALRLQ